jgi:hypothetical protein
MKRERLLGKLEGYLRWASFSLLWEPLRIEGSGPEGTL